MCRKKEGEHVLGVKSFIVDPFFKSNKVISQRKKKRWSPLARRRGKRNIKRWWSQKIYFEHRNGSLVWIHFDSGVETFHEFSSDHSRTCSICRRWRRRGKLTLIWSLSYFRFDFLTFCLLVFSSFWLFVFSSFCQYQT